MNRTILNRTGLSLLQNGNRFSISDFSRADILCLQLNGQVDTITETHARKSGQAFHHLKMTISIILHLKILIFATEFHTLSKHIS